MPINFDALNDATAASKPEVVPGRYTAEIVEAAHTLAKSNGRDMLNVRMKLLDTPDNMPTTLFDNQFDPEQSQKQSAKDFLAFKLKTFLDACGIQLSGTGELKDIGKLLPGKVLKVQVVADDKGYNTIDFSNNSDGYFPAEPATPAADRDDDALPEDFNL